MSSVGIDVSKGKSMIAVMRLLGEVIYSPFEVSHTSSELSTLARRLSKYNFVRTGIRTIKSHTSSGDFTIRYFILWKKRLTACVTLFVLYPTKLSPKLQRETG